MYNGEIYNFLALRKELEEEGIEFRGTSDTEVLLALYEKLGPSCLHRLNGMFAIGYLGQTGQITFSGARQAG